MTDIPDQPQRTPSDTELTETGLAPPGAAKTLFLACGALAREIIELKRLNGWHHVDLACLPAILHNAPDRIPEAVRAAVEQNRDRYDAIHVVYADCGTGGRLQATCEALGVSLVAGPHCYAFFDGLERFAARDEMTAFYLTDFLVRQFDAFVWKPLGLDRHPSLRDMYFAHYERVIYLAQVDDPALDAQAAAHAARLGLSYERRLTGFGDLAKTLAQWAAQDPSRASRNTTETGTSANASSRS